MQCQYLLILFLLFNFIVVILRNNLITMINIFAYDIKTA